MLSRLFPKQIDNTNRGHWLALAILAVILSLRSVMCFNGIFDTLEVATMADGIPVAKFTPDAAQAVLSLFALLAASNLVPILLGFVALLRYRALVPLVYLLLLLQSAASRAVGLLHPLTQQSANSMIGTAIILGLIAMTVLGFALSLQNRAVSPAPAAS